MQIDMIIGKLESLAYQTVRLSFTVGLLEQVSAAVTHPKSKCGL